MVEMHYEFAPLQGITTADFRALHCRMFGGVGRYYMPFFSPAHEHLLTAREHRELDPDRNAGVPAVPQVLTCRAEDFLWAIRTLADLGYREVNLNLGCPSGTVTAKGKGAGFLARPEELDRFFNAVFSAAPPISISVKTRLGVREAEEFFRLLEIYNRYPIQRVILHPRVQKDFYRNQVRLDAFRAALPISRHPLCYNGDLVTAAQCAAFCAAFETVDTVLIGRGGAADPALFRKLRGGRAADRQELRRFTGALYERYQASYGGRGPAAQRMKELWFYLIRLFGDGERYARDLRRVSAPREYERLEAGVFRDLPLREEPVGPLT